MSSFLYCAKMTTVEKKSLLQVRLTVCSGGKRLAIHIPFVVEQSLSYSSFKALILLSSRKQNFGVKLVILCFT